MLWEDERYVRLYTRDTTTWKLLPWQGRALLPLLLRKCDRAGVIELGDEGTDGIAALVDLPVEVVEPGFSALIKRGVIEQHAAGVVFPKFIEAQEVSKSDAARQKECRGRRRDLVRAGLAPDQRLPVVYFIQGENGGPIKIGRTDDLAKRLVGLSTGSPETLTVLASMPGTEADERAIHGHFSPIRIRGEWFGATPGLMAFVADVAKHGHEAMERVTGYETCQVTKRDESQNVTGHETFAVTPNHSVPSQAEPSLPGGGAGEPHPAPPASGGPANKGEPLDAKVDESKPPKPRGAKPRRQPEPDIVPAPGTVARSVFDAITRDPVLGKITVGPGTFSERISDPAAYPSVDVLSQVLRAAEYASLNPTRYSDGRAFLRNWLSRRADEVASRPTPVPAAPLPAPVRIVGRPPERTPEEKAAFSAEAARVRAEIDRRRFGDA